MQLAKLNLVNFLSQYRADGKIFSQQNKFSCIYGSSQVSEADILDK